MSFVMSCQFGGFCHVLHIYSLGGKWFVQTLHRSQRSLSTFRLVTRRGKAVDQSLRIHTEWRHV